MRRSLMPSPDSGQEGRASEWERTAWAALSVAVGAGVLAAVGRWDVGDLLFGGYFAAAGLLLWTQSVRIRLTRSTAPFTRTVSLVLVVAFCVGVLLGALDVVTGGVV